MENCYLKYIKENFEYCEKNGYLNVLVHNETIVIKIRENEWYIEKFKNLIEKIYSI